MVEMAAYVGHCEIRDIKCLPTCGFRIVRVQARRQDCMKMWPLRRESSARVARTQILVYIYMYIYIYIYIYSSGLRHSADPYVFLTQVGKDLFMW